MSKDTSEKTHELAQHPMPQWCRTGVCFPYTVSGHDHPLVIIGGFFAALGNRVGTVDRTFSNQQPKPDSLIFGHRLYFRRLDPTHLGHVQEIAIGFPVGAISGLPWATGSGAADFLQIFEPIIIALNGIPRTALAPLFIVWLGIGLWSKVGVVFLLTFFLNFFNTYSGMRQMDREYVDLANLMGVKGWKLTFE